MKDFESQLQKVRPKGLSSDERNALWSRIDEGIQVEGYIAAHKQSSKSSLTKKVIALVSAGALIAGSLGTAAYADEAKPGDLLFPIDLALEKVSLALAAPEKKNEVRLAIANERVDEVLELLETPTDEPQDETLVLESAMTQGDDAASEVMEIDAPMDVMVEPAAMMMLAPEGESTSDSVDSRAIIAPQATMEKVSVESVEVMATDFAIEEASFDEFEEELEELDEVEELLLETASDEVNDDVDEEETEDELLEELEDIDLDIEIDSIERVARTQKHFERQLSNRESKALEQALRYLEESKEIFEESLDESKVDVLEVYIEELEDVRRK